MELVNEHGHKVTSDKKLVDAEGATIEKETEQKPLTTKEVGQSFAQHLIESAIKAPTNQHINNQFDVLYHAALNIIGHRILNVGLGMEEGNTLVEWDASRAFAQEKEVQEHITITVEEWKQKFMNGELKYHAGKK